MKTIVFITIIVVLLGNIYLIPTFPTTQEKCSFIAVEFGVFIFSFLFNLYLERKY